MMCLLVLSCTDNGHDIYKLEFHDRELIDTLHYKRLKLSSLVKGQRGLAPANILYKSIAGRYRPVSYPDGPITRSGNFIIGASGSDKQLLCASSGTRAALNIAAEKSEQKRQVSHSSKESVFVG